MIWRSCTGCHGSGFHGGRFRCSGFCRDSASTGIRQNTLEIRTFTFREVPTQTKIDQSDACVHLKCNGCIRIDVDDSFWVSDPTSHAGTDVTRVDTTGRLVNIVVDRTVVAPVAIVHHNSNIGVGTIRNVAKGDRPTIHEVLRKDHRLNGAALTFHTVKGSTTRSSDGIFDHTFKADRQVVRDCIVDTPTVHKVRIVFNDEDTFVIKTFRAWLSTPAIVINTVVLCSTDCCQRLRRVRAFTVGTSILEVFVRKVI
mmetsp:Transcript_43135/g.104402  ORF Transcript_43135/g.104402 Transcript_43135/m.104402 type:complete len:255 (+) Transcript_43135:321-1085(+)